jgi:hypothetical protein
MQDFQAFTIKFSARMNVLFSKAGVSQAFDPNVTKINQPSITELNAIWDTGASCTLISKEYAAKVGLIPTGKTTITGVNNSTLENTYQVNVYLPNKVCLGFLRIAEAPALAGGAGMLIGMDIIGSGDFSVYKENGKTVMTYRFPSIGGTDFVIEAGNIKSHRAIMQKIEEQRINRKPLSKKERLKRKQQRKNKKRHKGNRR